MDGGGILGLFFGGGIRSGGGRVEFEWLVLEWGGFFLVRVERAGQMGVRSVLSSESWGGELGMSRSLLDLAVGLGEGVNVV